MLTTAIKQRNPTARQMEFLLAICEMWSTNGYPPTMRELGERFGIVSPNGIKCHVNALAKCGYLSFAATRARGLILFAVPSGWILLPNGTPCLEDEAKAWARKLLGITE